MKTLIIDVMNLASINFYACVNGDNKYPEDATTLLTTMRDIIIFGDMFKSNRFVWCFDGVGSLRKKHDPLYKFSATPTPTRSRCGKRPS
jgi:hypothetical protein